MENIKNIAPLADFDWDAFENDTVAGSADRAAVEAAYDNTLNNVHENEIAEGVVTNITKREVVVRIGSKSDGIIPVNEFRYNTELAVGDTVEVYIENLEDKRGQLVLSHKKARASKAWARINEAKENDEIISGFIKCRTKGGMIVDVFGLEAFLPGSQIATTPIRDYDQYVGKTMEFKVLKVNNEFKNVVISHKAILEAEYEVQRQQILSTLEVGQQIEGTVKNITKYGAFIDLGGVDGLVHISDLSWTSVSDPREVVKEGEKVVVAVKDINLEEKRIALSIKACQPSPWDPIFATYNEGDVIKGKVSVLLETGAIVSIVPGVDAFVHSSEISWSQHHRTVSDYLTVGEEVEAKILTLDPVKFKMTLSLKQLKKDPWEDVPAKYPVGSRHRGVVRNFTSFGLFVELEEGVDGLVHSSDLSWTKHTCHPSEVTQVGAEFDVVVLSVENQNRRLGLGHKQLEANPWEAFASIFVEGSVHTGTVVELGEKNAKVAFENGAVGTTTLTQLTKQDGKKAEKGETLEFKVLQFNKDTNRLFVSHTRTFDDSVAVDVATPKRRRPASAPRREEANNVQVQNQAASNSLGDNDALAALKAALEAGK